MMIANKKQTIDSDPFLVQKMVPESYSLKATINQKKKFSESRTTELTFDVATSDCSVASITNKGGVVLKYKLPLESKKNGLSMRINDRKIRLRHP